MTTLPTPTKAINDGADGAAKASAVVDGVAPSDVRMAVMRLARRLRQQSVGDITASQLSALFVLGRHGPLSLGELAAVEQVAPPSMTRIAARLEELGLLTRSADASDRRVARVVVTDAGRRVLDETRTARDAFLAERLVELSADDRELIGRALPVLRRLAGGQP